MVFSDVTVANWNFFCILIYSSYLFFHLLLKYNLYIVKLALLCTVLHVLTEVFNCITTNTIKMWNSSIFLSSQIPLKATHSPFPNPGNHRSFSQPYSLPLNNILKISLKRNNILGSLLTLVPSTLANA